MDAYIALLGIACVVNAACGGAILARDPGRTESRVSGCMHLGAAWWAACEIAWNRAGDSEAALGWVLASAPGWIFVGPIVLHTMVVLAEEKTRLRLPRKTSRAASRAGSR